MAFNIQNPSNMFGGSNVVFNYTPMMNFLAKKQAQRQATETATKKYFQSLTAKATSTGMRGDDIPAFDQALKNYQNFVTSNMDALAGGGNPNVIAQANELARMPFSIASQSKAAYDEAKRVDALSVSKSDEYARWSDQTTGKNSKTGETILDANGNPTGLVAFSQPIYTIDASGAVVPNPEFKPFNSIDVVVNPKRLTPKEMDDLMGGIAADVKPDQYEYKVDPHPTSKTTRVEYTVGTYTPAQLKKVETQARNLYNDNQIRYNFEVNHPFDDWKKGNEDQFNQLNAAYQKVNPGKNIEDDDDLFAAMAIYRKDQVVKSVPQDVADWDKQNKIQNNQRLQAIAYSAMLNKKVDQQYVNTRNVFDSFSGYTGKTASGKDIKIVDGKVYDASGAPYTGSDITVPNGNIPATFFVALKGAKAGDPDFIKGVNLTVNNGVIQGVQNPYTGQITREGMKLMQDITDKEGKGQQLIWGPVSTQTPAKKTSGKGGYGF